MRIKAVHPKDSGAGIEEFKDGGDAERELGENAGKKKNGGCYF